jgi:hypothetical protein
LTLSTFKIVPLIPTSYNLVRKARNARQ